MPNKDIHVVPAGPKWAVVIPDQDEHTMFVSQEEAIEAGIQRAQANKVELLIHGRDGQIRERHSFDHNQRNVKG